MKNKSLPSFVADIVLAVSVAAFGVLGWHVAEKTFAYKAASHPPTVNVSIKVGDNFIITPAYLPVVVNSNGVSFTGTDNAFHNVKGYVVIKARE